VPEAKSKAALAADVESYCCVCRSPCDYYRGQFTCAGWLAPSQSVCFIPVIVCKQCANAGPDPATLRCPLCEEGYFAPQAKPDLPALRGAMATLTGNVAGDAPPAPPRAATKRERQRVDAAAYEPAASLFVANLPFVACASEVRAALLDALAGRPPQPPDGTRAAKKWRREQRRTPPEGERGGTWGVGAVAAIRWLADPNSGLYGGAACVEMSEVGAATALVRAADAPTAPPPEGDLSGGKEGAERAERAGLRLRGRRLRIQYWDAKAHSPPPSTPETEWPPVGSGK
jgi:hypothetical protein